MSATSTQWPSLEELEAARRQLDDAVDAVQQMHERLTDYCEPSVSFEQVGTLSAFVAATKANSVALAAIVVRLADERDIAAMDGAEAVAA